MSYVFEDIVAEVSGWLRKENEKTRTEFLNTKEKDLIGYHQNLGRKIRNEFKLWETSWTPDIVNGVDMSDEHPDAISMRVIKKVWENKN